MQNKAKKSTQPTLHNNDGYLVVASKSKSFYYSAINLIESIKDHNPQAKTCLVVDKSISDDRVSVSDHVIYTEKEGDYRAKLWGMARTPFDRTFYIDADMECVHDDIATVFDQLGDHDMVFTKLCEDRDIAFKNRYFPAGQFELNGGVCLYNSADKKVLEFMQKWWELYTLQKADQWWPTDPETGEWDLVSYGDRDDNKWWDQFTLWWLTHKDEKWTDLSIGVFDDDLRWNYYTRFKLFSISSENPPILMHYSNTLQKDKPEIYEYS